MELLLNLVWLLVGVSLAATWLRVTKHSQCKSARYHRTTQCLALIAILVILFPVISVSDDLIAAQSPAETECCARKEHHGGSCEQSKVLHLIAYLPEQGFELPSLPTVHTQVQIAPVIWRFSIALHGIENRPPPTLL